MRRPTLVLVALSAVTPGCKKSEPAPVRVVEEARPDECPAGPALRLLMTGPRPGDELRQRAAQLGPDAATVVPEDNGQYSVLVHRGAAGAISGFVRDVERFGYVLDTETLVDVTATCGIEHKPTPAKAKR